MNIPVRNWRRDVAGTPVYWDLMDRDLRLYGPRAIWRDLQKQNLGGALLFNGVVSFGYTAEEAGAIAIQFPGKRLAAIVASQAVSTATLSIAIAAPHTSSLQLTPFIPFPDLRFTCTIQNGAPGAAALANAIEQGWAAKTLMQGQVRFSYDMRSAECGYDVEIDYRRCATWVDAQPGTQNGFSAADASVLMARYVSNNDATLINFVGLGEKPEQRALVRTKLAETLLAGVMDENGTLILFDNGERISRLRARAANTLAPAAQRFYVATSPEPETLETQFP